MPELLREHRPWEPNGRKHHAPAMDDMVDGEVVLRDAASGEVIAVQAILNDATADLRRHLRRALRVGIRWDDGGNSTSQARLNGMRYISRVFGFTEPKPLRKRYGCSASLLNREYPLLARILSALTGEFWRVFESYVPDVAAGQEKLVRELIHPDWLIGNQPWTSGIINNTAALPYHRDSGNLNTTWSAMLSVRSRVGGGGLHLPEYGVTLAVPDGGLVLFNGNARWHGVTPFNLQRKDAFRYTLVWYAKAGFVGAGPAAEEAKRAANRATRQAIDAVGKG